MATNSKAMYENAAANSLNSFNKRIRSTRDLNVLFGTGVDGAVLPVCYPVGYNKTTGKYAPWLAPAPTTVVVDMTGATAGTWTLTVNGVATASLAYNASAAVVKAALLDIGYVVTITKPAAIYTIVFNDEQDIDNPPTVTGATSGTMGEFGELATATPGTQAVATILTIDLGGASGGDYTITVGEDTTAAIAYNADAAAIQAALLAIGITATAVVGATTVVTFGAAAQLLELPTVSATLDGLTGDTNPTAVATAGTAGVATMLEVDLGTVTGGTFTITVGASTTATIAYNAAASAVVSALSSIGITATDVLADGVHTVTFGAAAQLLSLPTVSANLLALTGANAEVFAITAGTATYGTHKIKGFVYPEAVTLDDTNDTPGVLCVAGEVHYAEIAALIDAGSLTALQAALKDGLAPLRIQGLAGIY